MTVVLAFAAGFLAARLVWLLLRPTMSKPPFVVENFRGRPVATAAGIVVAVAVFVVEGTRAATGHPAGPDRTAAVVLVAGLAFLGLLDDLAGSPADRGFRGHLRALREGRLSTGALKLVGGAAISLGAVAVSAPAGPGRSTALFVADAALVALAANVGNLLDRAPGRALKAAAVSFVALAAATRGDAALTGVAVAVGAAVALLVDDLRERVMLGDTGANVVGGVLGLGVVMTGSTPARLAMLAGVLLLNVAAEVVSFSRVIEAVRPLRAIDRAGRRP